MSKPTEPFDLPYQLAGKFTLQRTLGSGSFGVVYLARQDDLDRPVAIKVLRPKILADPEQVRRFIAEARITATLSHPNIVRVIDCGHEGELPWIAYEHLGGVSLSDRLGRGPLTAAEAIAVTRQLASALEAAHERGVLHRDVKVENVLEDRNGVFKLTDFGIARWTTARSIHTAAGEIVGTPEAMAPEYIAHGHARPSCDLYALGVLLFRLLTGRPPFEAASLAGLLQAHLDQPAPRPSSLRSGLPPAVDRIVMSLLEKEPADRPGSAGALVAALHELETDLRDRPASGVHRTEVARVARPGPRTGTLVQRVLPAGAATTGRRVWPLMVLLMVGVSVGLAALGRSREDRAAPAPLLGSGAGSPSTEAVWPSAAPEDPEDVRDFAVLGRIRDRQAVSRRAPGGAPSAGSQGPTSSAVSMEEPYQLSAEVVLRGIRRGDARGLGGFRWLTLETEFLTIVDKLSGPRGERLRAELLAAAAAPGRADADPCRRCLTLTARWAATTRGKFQDQIVLERANLNQETARLLRQMEPASRPERRYVLGARAGKLRLAWVDYTRAHASSLAWALGGGPQVKGASMRDVETLLTRNLQETLVLARELSEFSSRQSPEHRIAVTVATVLGNLASASTYRFLDDFKGQMAAAVPPLVDQLASAKPNALTDDVVERLGSVLRTLEERLRDQGSGEAIARLRKRLGSL
ncbi:MAG: serine/threonine protein kinase [Candidatus Riflebacteria bacterium]|nr:serine/threonine protein kinase [Candidatus Riflebacteria bacterium]